MSQKKSKSNSKKKKMQKTNVARPTPVDKALYIEFANKCRTEEKQVKKVLTGLIEGYIKKVE